MEEQLISFETAKLAKEKGFDISTHSYYFEDNKFKENSIKGTNGYYGDEYEFNLSEFNENWNDKWLTKKTGDRCFGCSKQKGYLETFSAPTQSLLQKWLREVHDIHIDIRTNTVSGGNYFFYLFQTRAPFYTLFVSEKNSDNYEKALECALKESLKLIK